MEANVIHNIAPAQMTDDEIDRIRTKRRRKVFVKWLKRVVVGPILGFWLAIISFNLFHTSMVVSMLFLMTFTCVGLLV
ncbi:MAG TPA: hypothetical protein VL947_08250, partial [Cytophagales bacterium]|nr:hypothetical protein [Cytophagales bacterium]